MGPLVVVEVDPVADHAVGVLQGFKAVPMNALLLQCPDHPLYKAVLLRRVERDELLVQSIAFDQRRVAAAGEDQAVVRAKQERRLHTSQRAEASNQGLLQGSLYGTGLAASPEVPAQQIPAEAVDHQRQCDPAVTARPDTSLDSTAIIAVALAETLRQDVASS